MWVIFNIPVNTGKINEIFKNNKLCSTEIQEKRCLGIYLNRKYVPKNLC